MQPKTVLVTNKSNILYLSGFAGTNGFVVLNKGKNAFFTDARYHEEAKENLLGNYKLIDITEGFEQALLKYLKKNRIKTLGIEGNSVTFQQWKKLKKELKGIVIKDIGNEISEYRTVKKNKEIEAIKRSQSINDEVFLAIKKWLKQGISEQEIGWKIKSLAHDFGAQDISFEPIVAIQEHSAAPHHKNSTRKIKSGDILLIDMGVKYENYCSDMTRVIFTKVATIEQKNVYEIVKNAQETAIEKLRPNMTGKKIHNIAQNIIEKAGYGDFFRHSLGHGVGLDIHELPNLSQKYAKKIPINSVITVEPGIYLPGKFGIRLEDMVVVGSKGVTNLTASPKAIQENTITLK